MDLHILDMDGWRLCDGSAGNLDRDVFFAANLPDTGACPRCLDVWNARLVQECLERTA